MRRYKSPNDKSWSLSADFGGVSKVGSRDKRLRLLPGIIPTLRPGSTPGKNLTDATSPDPQDLSLGTTSDPIGAFFTGPGPGGGRAACTCSGHAAICHPRPATLATHRQGRVPLRRVRAGDKTSKRRRPPFNRRGNFPGQQIDGVRGGGERREAPEEREETSG